MTMMQSLTRGPVIGMAMVLGLATPVFASNSVVVNLPPGSLATNPETGSDDGSTALAPPGAGVTWYVKGQTFALAAPGTVTSVTVRVDEGSAGSDFAGSLTLELFAVSGGLPTGTALATQTDPLPVVSAGDYLEIRLDAPPELAAGSYAFALSSTDLTMNFDVQNVGGNYPAGDLVRYNGTSWQLRPTTEFVFAVSGTAGSFTLSSPATWPASFLENMPLTGPDQIGLNPSQRLSQGFALSDDARIDRFVFQIEDTTTGTDLDGSVTLEIFATDARGRPTGSALVGLTGELPGGIAPGSFLAFDFPVTVSLEGGLYAAVLSTADTDLLVNNSSDDLYADGVLAFDPGTGWVNPTPLGQDLVFGLAGEIDTRPLPGTGPNILVILADDLGWTDLSTGAPNLGNPSDMYQTPNIARLADEGLSFTACYVQPNCAPTRAALFSGKYAPRTGNGVYNVSGLNRGTGTPVLLAPSQNEDVPASTHTLAEMLYDAGYVTAHIGKYHIGGHEGGSSTLPLEQGFDVNFGGGAAGNPGNYFADGGGVFHANVGPELDGFGMPYSTNYINEILVPLLNGNNPSTLTGSAKHLTDGAGDAAIAFLNDHRAGPLAAYPFYLQYHAWAVHTPIQPRPDLSAKYAGNPGTVHDNSNYAGLVEGLDQSVGRILNYLDDPNGDGNPSDSIAGETLVVFFSDNGGHEGPTDNAPLRSRKGSFYEGGIRVPMIARMPGTVPSNEVTRTLVHAVDIYPTLMEVAGGATFQTLDGVSYAAHMMDPAGQPRDRGAIFYHFPGYLDNRARPCSAVVKEIRGKRYKLIYNYDPTYDPNTGDDGIAVLPGNWELYNVTDDLGEANNLLELDYWEWITHQAVAQELAAELNAWLTQSDPDWAPSYPSVRATGERLGPAPAVIDPVVPPPGQAFHILQAHPGTTSNQVDLSWVSDADFRFGIDASFDLLSWTNLAAGIPGENGSTDRTVNDPGETSGLPRFYRVFVTP